MTNHNSREKENKLKMYICRRRMFKEEEEEEEKKKKKEQIVVGFILLISISSILSLPPNTLLLYEMKYFLSLFVFLTF